MSWFGANKVKSSTGQEVGERTKRKYLVATGAIVFTQYAASDKEALELVKERLKIASSCLPNRYDSERLSGSLLESFMEGKLDFIVMDEDRSRLLCGEYAGVFEKPVSRRLAASLKHLIPPLLEVNRGADLKRIQVGESVNEEPDLQMCVRLRHRHR